MQPDDAQEAALCALARRGDRSAFAQLVRLHQGRVRLQLRRLARGDAALADDLAQETFIQAWDHFAEFAGQSRLATWLHRIAYTRFLMHLRSLRETEELGEAAQPGPSASEASAMRLDVQGALAQLPQEQQVAMLHCYWLDLSHQEAAQVLGLPLGTLKSQLLRARALLRDALSAWAPEEQA